MEISQFEWVCTDPNNQQYGRQISDMIFEFKEPLFDYKFEGITPKRFKTDEEIKIAINLSEYSENDMYDYVSSYYGYDDFKEFLKTNEGRWVIAECIFELESGNY